MTSVIAGNRSAGRGFVKGILVCIGAAAAASIAHTAAVQVGLPPTFFEGAAGGGILGAFAYDQYRKATKSLNSRSAGSPHSADRLEFDPPRRAKVTHPPNEPREYDVLAVDINPDGGLPFRVWVKDGKEEWHPFYATAVEFFDEEV